MSTGAMTTRGVVATNLAAIRTRVGMSSAQDLADRVKELGGRLDRAAISKIESGTRNVSLDEAVLLAAALDVAPVHLLVPLDDAAQVQIVPSRKPVTATAAREWVRGRRPLPMTNARTYRTSWVPESEWEQRNARVEDAREGVEQAERLRRVAKAALKEISSDLGRISGPGSAMQQMFGGIDPAAQQELLERKLDAAYERVAEATVDLEDAKAHLREVQAEDGD